MYLTLPVWLITGPPASSASCTSKAADVIRVIIIPTLVSIFPDCELLESIGAVFFTSLYLGHNTEKELKICRMSG